LRLKSGHAALLVVHLAWLNFSPRALLDRISGGNAAISYVLTGPWATGIQSMRGADVRGLASFVDLAEGTNTQVLLKSLCL
jgi:hypothetical protein